MSGEEVGRRKRSWLFDLASNRRIECAAVTAFSESFTTLGLAPLCLALVAACSTEPDPATIQPQLTPVAVVTPRPVATEAPTPTPTVPPPAVVILLRHGEKAESGGEDPPLSASGRARAELLVHMFEHTGITAIYATHFRRTQQTAQPLADRLHLPIHVVDAHDVDEMIRQIRSNSGGVVLAVGHSDSTVTIAQAFGVGPLEPISLDDYDNLYVVTFDAAGAAHLVTMQYGASTPSEP
jgi:phosphohistidine phosphatase SixA